MHRKWLNIQTRIKRCKKGLKKDTKEAISLYAFIQEGLQSEIQKKMDKEDTSMHRKNLLKSTGQ